MDSNSQNRRAINLANEIQSLVKQNDPASLKQASILSKKLTTALDAPEDTAVQLSFMVRLNFEYIDSVYLVVLTRLAPPSALHTTSH